MGSTGELPPRLPAVSYTLRGGPLPPDGGFLTPAYSVAAAREQLDGFEAKLTETVSEIDELLESSGTTVDLGVEGCGQSTLQQHVKARLRTPHDEPHSNGSGSMMDAETMGEEHAEKVAIILANYRDRAKGQRLDVAASSSDPFPKVECVEAAEEEWVDAWVAASRHLYALQTVPHETLHDPRECKDSAPPGVSGPAYTGESVLSDTSPESSSSGKVAPNEVVLHLAVFDPYRKERRTQEYFVLGSTPLSAIDKMVYCLNNLYMTHFGVAKTSYFLYVEGTFYQGAGDDDGKAEDLSEPICRFCEQHGISAPGPAASSSLAEHERPVVRSGDDAAPTPGNPVAAASLEELSTQRSSSSGPFYPFRKAEIQGKCFSDLWLRVGNSAGYIYCHQGCCEHAVVVKDVRRIHPTDCQERKSYPLLVFQSQPQRRKCSICRHRLAVKMTTESEVAPEPVCFYCEECYLQLHYNAAGALNENAKHMQFPYFHD